MEKISLNHGAGGRQMHKMINEIIKTELSNPILDRFDDSALINVLESRTERLAMTTDSFVVDPLFFPGGDIGRLAVSGTVNDLASSGAQPLGLTLGFIIEEGLEIETLQKVLSSLRQAADEANVSVVTGDTKVVPKGKGDGLYINTSACGFIPAGVNLSSYNVQADDDLIVTGPIGNHEMSLVLARKLVDLNVDVVSDVAPLNRKVEELLKKTLAIHCIKDPTRGGVASALVEMAEHSNLSITIDENEIPLDKEVRGLCKLTGFDPLYLANEGKYVIACPKTSTPEVLKVFPQAKVIGVAHEGDKKLLLRTQSGGLRRLVMLETVQLPRIC